VKNLVLLPFFQKAFIPYLHFIFLKPQAAKRSIAANNPFVEISGQKKLSRYLIFLPLYFSTLKTT